MKLKHIFHTVHFRGKKKTRGRRGVPSVVLFMAAGFLATLWFLVRVIPKPSRATYPCMRASAPLMSAFVIWLTGIIGSSIGLRRVRILMKNRRFLGASLAGILLIVSLAMVFVSPGGFPGVFGSVGMISDYEPNQPVGVPKGIFPGRVVWAWDPGATNENMTNTAGDYWFQNTDQDVVDTMLSNGIMKLTGEQNVAVSWDKLFRHFNDTHQRGEKGYISGEKIFIKLNLTTSSVGGMGTWSTTKTNNLDLMDATPQLVLALLRQLINDCGIAEENITVGDPFRRFHDVYWDMCHDEFPGVNYMDDLGINGRLKTTLSESNLLVFSDHHYSTPIPQAYVDAAYFINMACLKTHNAGGITLCGKNHQGSVIQPGETNVAAQSASYMHYSLPSNSSGHNKYRHLVDYLGHRYLGGNTVLNIVDGIWAGRDWWGYVDKWQMEPFDNDFPNSIFLSQDPVAIDAVCFDFILTEYENRTEKWPFYPGTDDYLLQCADTSQWPEGIVYDPEDDGTPLTSLGVYEHWNNPGQKQYSVNLGRDYGIHLVSIPDNLVESFPQGTGYGFPGKLNLKIFPNPASGAVKVSLCLDAKSNLSIRVFDTGGKLLIGKEFAGVPAGDNEFALNTDNLEEGVYIVRLNIDSGSKSYSGSLRFSVVK